jgi:ribonuclease BN (tRNA processing enzyme)
MKLTILGSGTFFVSVKRSGPAYLLESSGKKILIDCGPGTLSRLAKIGIKPQELDYVLITHFHADHTADLFPFLMNLRLAALLESKDLNKYPIFYGPKGIHKFLQEMSKNHQLPFVDVDKKIKYLNFKKIQRIGDLMVEAFNVSHVAGGIKANANALRFRDKKRVFVFSGDSARCLQIEKAAKDADVFLCDTSYPKEMGNQAHMDTYDIGEISEKANVKKVILTHIYPQEENIDLVGQVKRKFGGKVLLAKDLMKVEI